MPERIRQRRSFAFVAAALGLLVVLIGALVWFRPYLTGRQASVSGVPAPPALTASTVQVLVPGQQACMGSVTVEPDSLAAQFHLGRGTREAGAPPFEFVLSAPGYSSASRGPAGSSGVTSVAITPPPHSVLATACFVNRGRTNLYLDGSSEARTISRSPTTVNGVGINGDITLTFLNTRRASLLDRLGTIFGHASNLTEGLIPVWLIWILVALLVLGMPIGVFAAFYAGLREDEARAHG